MKKYAVNEVYYSVHGEGVRYGIPHVFVRLAYCNLACDFCDTEHESAICLEARDIVAAATSLAASKIDAPRTLQVPGATHHGEPLPAQPCRNVLFCGGEPLLQLDAELIEAFKTADPIWFLAVETNGTRPAPPGLDWITCSPKVAEHAVKLEYAHELKYVRGAGQAIPHPRIPADYYLISPVFDGDQADPAAMATCLALVLANPSWRLTVQHHKTTFGVVR